MFSICYGCAVEIRLKILRIKDVLEVTGVSRTTLWRMIQGGYFPQPGQVSFGIRGWPDAEVRAWVKSKWRPSDDSSAQNASQPDTNRDAEERPQVTEPTTPSALSRYGEIIWVNRKSGWNSTGKQLTMREIARRTEYPYPRVRMACLGETRGLTRDLNEKLCKLLGLDAAAMWRIAKDSRGVRQKQEGVGLTNLPIAPSSNETKSSGKKTPAPRKRQN